MKYVWSTITVKNMAESIQFYNEIVGLPLVNRYPAGPGTELAFMGTGETQIELICHEAQQDVRIGEDISLGFEVPSLDDMMVFIKEKGMAVHSGPYQPNPHVKFFFVLDPNGLKIQFVEHN